MRIELIHPMLVHFPIALLLIGAGLKAAAYLFRRSQFYAILLITARLILTIGVCFAWLAALAGGFAADIVEKTLCRPEFLDEHSTLAITAASLFTAGIVVEWARALKKSYRFRKLLVIASSLLFFVGAIVLVFTASLGGSLVYDQGAAVEKKCNQ
jgi:uncharacterized membrane protein